MKSFWYKQHAPVEMHFLHLNWLKAFSQWILINRSLNNSVSTALRSTIPRWTEHEFSLERLNTHCYIFQRTGRFFSILKAELLYLFVGHQIKLFRSHSVSEIENTKVRAKTCFRFTCKCRLSAGITAAKKLKLPLRRADLPFKTTAIQTPICCVQCRLIDAYYKPAHKPTLIQASYKQSQLGCATTYWF